MPFATTARTELAKGQIYTMRELNQHTARVLDEINRSGRPAAITKHGRWIALISPLCDAQIESVVLSHGPLARELNERAADADSDTYTAEEMTKRVREHYRDQD